MDTDGDLIFNLYYNTVDKAFHDLIELAGCLRHLKSVYLITCF